MVFSVNAHGLPELPNYPNIKSASELDYPPFSIIKPDGSADGFSVDLLKEVIRTLGLKINFAVGPWSEIKHSLETGKIDVLPLVAISKERREHFDFTVPYIHLHGTIFVRQGDDRIMREEDLKGKELIVMKGDLAHEYINRKKLSEKVILTESFEDAFKLLSKGSHDAILVQYLVGQSLVKSMGVDNVVVVPGDIFKKDQNDQHIKTEILSPGVLVPEFEYKFCFAVRKGNSELLAVLNEGIAIVIANGTYDRLYHKWFSPILPPQPISKKLLFIYLLYILIPILLVIFFSGILFLKREVRRKTSKLHKEIQERIKVQQDLDIQAKMTKNMTEGVYLARLNDGIIIYANPRFERMFGYNEGEIVSNHLSILFSSFRKTDRKEPNNIIEKIQENSYWRGETQNIKKDGTRIWCYVSASTFRHQEHGDVIVFLHSDITKQKKIEEENLELEGQLYQKQKMAAIGTLAAGIAHDFNNILSPIYVYVQFLQSKIHDDPENKQYLDEIFSSAVRARDLVKQILTFSRQNHEKYSRIDVCPIINEAAKMLRSMLPSTIEIQERVESKCGFVRGNSTQIHQVIMNLGTNAYHAMRERGGVLSLELKEIVISANDSTSGVNLAPGPYFLMNVIDEGTGINKDIISKIFEPYFTTKEKGEGTGMGLSVVHGIVKNHGGDIIVESELGSGSSFRVYFPIVKGEQPLEEKKPSDKIPTGDERILLIDDEEKIIKMGKVILEDLGYQVTTYISPIQALEHFRDQPNLYDLVITDMTMPHITGIELARIVITIRPDMPILLCSGFNDIDDVEQASKGGISGYIKKPYHIKDIAEIIRELIDKRSRLN